MSSGDAGLCPKRGCSLIAAAGDGLVHQQLMEALANFVLRPLAGTNGMGGCHRAQCILSCEHDSWLGSGRARHGAGAKNCLQPWVLRLSIFGVDALDSLDYGFKFFCTASRVPTTFRAKPRACNRGLTRLKHRLENATRGDDRVLVTVKKRAGFCGPRAEL